MKHLLWVPHIDEHLGTGGGEIIQPFLVHLQVEQAAIRRSLSAFRATHRERFSILDAGGAL
ncbi:MAG: hypothetical protein ACK56I_04605, partial [bacterium]